jgi:hypothetical protein
MRHGRFRPCVTIIVMSNGDAQLYERCGNGISSIRTTSFLLNTDLGP